MPLYEYECPSCGTRFERIQKFSDPPEASCPKCHAPAQRQLSPPAIQFKGSGWYVTDYARKSTPAEKPESGESKKEAEKPARPGEPAESKPAPESSRKTD
jgi:putative FmdB family regulatory protein